MSSCGDKAAMYISWTTWNLLAAIFLTLLYLFAFRMTKWWETEVTRVPLRNTRVALVTFGGLPLLAYVLGSIACTLSDPIAVARVAFIYMAVLLPASLFFLFIATRRESLFNQYATSLDRLGLLRKRQLRVATMDA
jgi:predicted small integral membrane protein